ncbi:MAG: hypothetical protein COA94_07025 [Rickettsiales bacterium]|nr:MAG: hypothetical protein COA94_07025 [Rickettsiales bacterium]
MIRKIALFTILILVTIWFSWAYLIKGNILKAIDNLASDNIKFSYQGSKISGFPFDLKLRIISPKVTIIDQTSLHEFSTKEIEFKFGYSFKSSVINLGKKIIYNKSNGNAKQEYTLLSEENIIIAAGFKRPFCFMSPSLGAVKDIASIHLTLPKLECRDRSNSSSSSDDTGSASGGGGGGGGDSHNQPLFTASSIELLSLQETDNIEDRFSLKFTGEYDAPSQLSKIAKAHLSANLNYISKREYKEPKEVNFEKKLEIQNIKLKLGDALLAINGALKLTKSALPQGRINVSMVKYQEIIDALIPENFIISPSRLKKTIDKTTTPQAINPASADFHIIFSEKGISMESSAKKLRPQT